MHSTDYLAWFKRVLNGFVNLFNVFLSIVLHVLLPGKHTQAVIGISSQASSVPSSSWPTVAGGQMYSVLVALFLCMWQHCSVFFDPSMDILVNGSMCRRSHNQNDISWTDPDDKSRVSHSGATATSCPLPAVVETLQARPTEWIDRSTQDLSKKTS